MTGHRRSTHPNRKDPVPRFWAKVDTSDRDGCWLWTGSFRHQYGEFWLEGKREYAHRVSAFFACGRPLEPSDVVLHTCDNPPCVRPDHLVIGDVAANARDCSEKGRWCNQYRAGPNATGESPNLPTSPRWSVDALVDATGARSLYDLATKVTGQHHLDKGHRRVRGNLVAGARMGGITTARAVEYAEALRIDPETLWPEMGGTSGRDRLRLARQRRAAS